MKWLEAVSEGFSLGDARRGNHQLGTGAGDVLRGDGGCVVHDPAFGALRFARSGQRWRPGVRASTMAHVAGILGGYLLVTMPLIFAPKLL
jgi:hypothetical protein